MAKRVKGHAQKMIFAMKGKLQPHIPLPGFRKGIEQKNIQDDKSNLKQRPRYGKCWRINLGDIPTRCLTP
jgi:hypothetical protein